jgi:hypothetical protein
MASSTIWSHCCNVVALTLHRLRDLRESSGLRLALILRLLAISLLLEQAKVRISQALATRSVTQNQILLRRCMNCIGSLGCDYKNGA